MRDRTVSVRQKRFIMRLDTNFYRGKPPSLEEASTRYERISENFNSNHAERNNGCNRCTQFVKVILYVALILFIGWIGCIFVRNYYWNDRYNSGETHYIIPEWAQDPGKDSVIHSDHIPGEDTKWSTRRDDMKPAIEKNEIYTELIIEGKNYFIETDTTTISSVMVDMNLKDDLMEAMLMSKWFLTLRQPSKKSEESSPKSDSFWGKMMTSIGEQNDKSYVSSKEKMKVTTDSSTAPKPQNYFDINDKENDEFSDMDIDELLSDQLWQDILGASDHEAIIANQDKAFSQDVHFTGMRFDFQLPDLVKRRLSRQAITTNGDDDSSSSSSSEETNSPAPEIKRSMESSSSEETKNPPPKVKRSTDSSSSESDSSDSSSHDNEQPIIKAIKGSTSCPKILDNDGRTIDDPQDIVNHIKGNWFNWLLETPVPDCDEQTSAKTVTIDECGKFVIKCAHDESDEIDGKESVTNHRDTRSVEESNGESDMCDRSLNVTRENLKTLSIGVVIGETSDAILTLRQDFVEAVIWLVTRRIAEQSTGEQNTTDHEWQNALIDLKRTIAESTDADHRQQLEANGSSTQEMANELRNTVESMTKIYKDCVDSLATSEKSRRILRVLTMMVERQKCLTGFGETQAKEKSLAAEIVTGESSDSTVIELRRTFKSMILALARMMTIREANNADGTSTANTTTYHDTFNVTDEQWSTHMFELKREIANATEDSTIRQRIEASGPPTQEQTNELRAIMEYYLRTRQCDDTTLSGLRGALRDTDHDGNRTRRSDRSKWRTKYSGASGIYNDERYSRDKRNILTNPKPKSMSAGCWIEDDVAELLKERRARLEAWPKKRTKHREYEEQGGFLDIINKELNAENALKIDPAIVPQGYSFILTVTNTLMSNCSSDLIKEGYELLQDVILEFQKVANHDPAWKGYIWVILDMIWNFANCVGDNTQINGDPSALLQAIIKSAESMDLQYSELDKKKHCGAPFNPVYRNFTYVGKRREKLGLRNWRHILDGIVKWYLKVYEPSSHPGFKCDLIRPSIVYI